MDILTDYFALLNERRLPWLGPEELKANFLALSATVHPDRVHTAPGAERQEANRRYAELNAAYQCLREPKDRLLHLLELERGSRPRDVQRIPPGTMDLFAEVGQVCRDIDHFLAEKAQSTSPMLRVRFFQAATEWTEKVNTLQQRINARRDELMADLRELNVRFETAPAPGHLGRREALPLDRLEEIYRVLSYIARWTAQLQERLVQLSF